MSIKSVTTAILAAGLAIVPLQMSGQQGSGKPAKRKEIPKLINGKPDFSGTYQHPYVPDMSKSSKDGKQKGAELPYSPKGKQVFDAYDATTQGDYAGTCMPFGLVRSVNSPHPLQIVHNTNTFAFLFEQNTWFHAFPTDGRPMPKEPDRTWFGTTVGRWEGDKLIADTAYFNGFTRLDTLGHPHSKDMKVNQTFEYADPNNINYTITIDDPKAYTKPFTNYRVWTFRPDWELMEYACEENNKDIFDGLVKPWLPRDHPSPFE